LQRIEGTLKFAATDAAGSESWYPYDDRWSLQRTTPERLVIAPARGRHVDLLLDLARCVREPFGILYVLVVPRTGEHADGRYQSPHPTTLAATEAFVQRFRGYFEGDGRHHLWLMSLPDAATLVYDNHDVIYAYGPLARYRAVLANRGFRESPVQIPDPHQHRYNQEFDGTERALIEYWGWRHFPLQPGDDR
jgi:hypothetical protein